MEEGQEAAINGRRSQNSERVRAHLYEREFRGKPVSRADCAHDRGCARVRFMRRTRQGQGHARFLRTNVTCIWGVSDPRKPVPGPCSGVAEGVAHAPDASITAADNCADCHTGGKQRRPIDSGEVADSTEHRPRHPEVHSRSRPGSLNREPCMSRGDHCSRVCVPPAFPSLSWKVTASRGRRVLTSDRVYPRLAIRSRDAGTLYDRTVKRKAVDILKEALALPSEQRAALAASLLDSLDTDVDEDPDAAWAIEVNRRVTELDAGVVKTIAWAEVRRRLAAH